MDPKLREKWEEELTAAIEAEYRLQRVDLLLAVEWWLRDVWVQTLKGAKSSGGDEDLLSFPKLASTGKIRETFQFASDG